MWYYVIIFLIGCLISYFDEKVANNAVELRNCHNDELDTKKRRLYWSITGTVFVALMFSTAMVTNVSKVMYDDIHKRDARIERLEQRVDSLEIVNFNPTQTMDVSND
jgi:hypothetical protein